MIAVLVLAGLLDEQMPGKIKIVVRNAQDSEASVVLVLDGLHSQIIPKGNSEVLFSPVFPGSHHIEITGKIDGTERKTIELIQVRPNEKVRREVILE